MPDEQPSATAVLSAKSVVLARREGRFGSLLPALAGELSESFVAAAEPGSWFLRLAGQVWFRELVRAAEKRSLPGFQLHQLLRRRWLEESTRHALGEGFMQVVVLGAGFATLAARLAREYPGVTWIEIDHPATQSVKRGVLEERRMLPANLTLQPADLHHETLARVLRTCSTFNAQARTLYVAEGLLMYLRRADVEEIFAFVGAEEGARILFSFVQPGPDGQGALAGKSGFVRRWLFLAAEPFRWGIRADDLAAFASASHLQISQILRAAELRRLLANTPFEREFRETGEYLALGDTPLAG